MSKLPITVIILTFNEEVNILNCLQSVSKLSNDIVIVDSYSTDRTIEIANSFSVKIFQHPFENYAKQRNWALQNVIISNEWIMNIDADHRVMPEMVDELKHYFENGIPDNVNGFFASRRTMFLNKWIRHGGHFPVYHGIIFRKGKGICEEKEYDQHFLISGDTIVLKSNVIDIITDSLTTFIQRHNKWATLEALDAMHLESEVDSNSKVIKPNKNGNLMEQRRYQRLKYYSYPIFTRTFIYFIYRFFFKLGFRDGKEGLIFHILQGFWFRFLVDAKIYELKLNEFKK